MSTTFPVIKGVLLSSKHYTWNTADSLGRGASAIVYLGRQRETGLVVAVKSFHKHLLAANKHADLRELELLRQMHHPNIIQLLDIQFEEGSKQPVLIMEYCEGGSLHHMLEQPAYYFGLPELQYILVLTHVASGMSYLRSENIIHRDIKPGNIMRFITDEGNSIYKLTDFGAARSLDEEEQFESLYGTEEYLHPGVYERAVLRHPTGTSFDARVDLWSLGVTFFHAATGRLPFQPFGGRSNKEIMFQIISEKDRGVISGIQKSQNGPIEWRRELPESCPLSNGLRAIVTPLLSGLMEANQNKMISYDSFFNIVDNLQLKTTISIFHLACCQEIVIYVDSNSMYSDLQDIIASQVDISASDQILLVDGKRVDDVVGATTRIGDYPAEILEDAIFLFKNSNREEFNLKNPEINAFPDLQTYTSMEIDSRNANMCSAQGELISRYAKTVSKRQDLILRGVICLRLYVESRHASSLSSHEVIQSLLDEFGVHLNNFFGMVDILKSVVSHPRSNVREKEKLEGIVQENVVRPVFEKAKERLLEIAKYRKNLSTRLEETKISASKLVSHCKKEKCCQKMSHHQSVISGIQSRFRRDKNVRHQMTAHDENIHHFERQKLSKHCKALKSILVQHCFVQQERLFRAALKVVDTLTRCLFHVNKIEVNMNSVLNCQNLLSGRIVKIRQSISDVKFTPYSDTTDKTEDSLISANSSLVSISEQTKSLESKLMDVTQLLAANSDILRSFEDAPMNSLASQMGNVSVQPSLFTTGAWNDKFMTTLPKTTGSLNDTLIRGVPTNTASNFTAIRDLPHIGAWSDTVIRDLPNTKEAMKGTVITTIPSIDVWNNTTIKPLPSTREEWEDHG